MSLMWKHTPRVSLVKAWEYVQESGADFVDRRQEDCLFALFHYGYVRDGVDRTVEGRVLRRTEAGKGVSRRKR